MPCFLSGHLLIRLRFVGSVETCGDPSASHCGDMIAGNPKTGRTMVTLSLALLLLILVTTALVALRKRTAPEKQPPLPLHPSTLFVRIRSVELSAGRNVPQLCERFGCIG